MTGLLISKVICKSQLIFISLILILNSYSTLSDNNMNNINQIIFIEKISNDFERSFNNNLKMISFLKKYNLNAIDKNFYSIVSRYNVTIYEGLIRNDEDIDLEKFKKNLITYANTNEFNKLDNIRFYLLNFTDIQKINHPSIQNFLKNEEGKIFECILSKKNCSKLNLDVFFNKKNNLNFLSISLETLQAFDKDKTKIITENIINNIYKNEQISLSSKLKINYDLNISLPEFLSKKVKQKFIQYVNDLNQNDLNKIMYNKVNFENYNMFFIDERLKDLKQLNKTWDFTNKYKFLNNRITRFLKNNPSKISEIHLIRHMIEMHHLDPDYNSHSIIWHNIAKTIEQNSKILTHVGSELHLQSLDLLIKTSSLHEPFLAKSLTPLVIKMFEKQDISDNSLNNIFTTYITYLERNENYEKIINLYSKKIKVEKNKLKKITNDKKVDDLLPLASYLLICNSSLKISQYYLHYNNNVTDAYKTIDNECYKNIIPKIETGMSKNILTDIIFQRNFSALMQNYLYKDNIEIDVSKLKNYLNDPHLTFSNKIKILIPLTMHEKSFHAFNVFFKKHLFNNFQNITIDKSDNEVPFLLKMSEFILPQGLYKNSGISSEEYFKLHKIILKLMINQMINEAKSIAFDKNYSTKTKSESLMIKQFGQILGVKNKRKSISLLSQLLLNQYIIEKDKLNLNNSDLLRLMILSKFSHSESLVNLKSIYKDFKKAKFKEYLRVKNQIIHFSFTEQNKQKNLNNLINKYIELSLKNNRKYLKSNLEYIKKLFNFDEKIVSLIQSNLTTEQLYINYYHVKDLDILILFSISKHKTNIKLIKNAENIKKKIEQYVNVINGKKQNFYLNEAYLIKEKILPKSIIDKSIQNIRVSLDSFLYNVPFSALPLNQTSAILFPAKHLSQRGINNQNLLTYKSSNLKGVKWLGDKYYITYIPSTIKFKKDYNTKKDQNLSFLGIGNPNYKNSNLKLKPLPNTREEILSISKLFNKTNKTLLLDENANEEKLHKIINNKFDIIAFATHGFMSEEYSPTSEPGLALTNSQNDLFDGYLASSEVISFDLNAKWVLLNACNTFNNQNPNLNPFSGLPSSFLSAGAEGVMSTLWPIETISAKKLSYYSIKNYRKDFNRSKALSLGQKKLREKYSHIWSHPYYWAPYINVESTIN